MNPFAPAVVLTLVAVTFVHAINLNQTDTFDSGLLENWNGAAADIGTGGPAGTNDNFLILTANGSGGRGFSQIIEDSFCCSGELS